MNCAISVVIIGWDGYFFHDEIVATDTYFLGKQKGGCACGYKNEHQQYRSSFTNESVERIRKGKYEYLSF